MLVVDRDGTTRGSFPMDYLTNQYGIIYATISPLCHSERSGTDIENQAIKSKNAAESNPEGAPAGGISALVYGISS